MTTSTDLYVLRAECARLAEALEAARDALTEIDEYAHYHSQGPAEPDRLWDIYMMAAAALQRP